MCDDKRTVKKEIEMSIFVCQKQFTTDEVEVLWTCTSEQQADDECERINSTLSLAGIPGEYHAFVLA